jgi:hypothetical protein
MRSSSGMMTVVRDSANRRSRRFSPPGKAGDRPEKTTEIDAERITQRDLQADQF